MDFLRDQKFAVDRFPDERAMMHYGNIMYLMCAHLAVSYVLGSGYVMLIFPNMRCGQPPDGGGPIEP